MDNSFGFPATPGMPLFPLSPGRVNALPQSPSAPRSRRTPTASPAKVFGHPEFGVPGDFGIKSFVLADDATAFDEPTLAITHNFDLKLPSLPGSPSKHVRTNSEVQAMVSRFNSLDIKDHAELWRKDAAALKRAQMGREEAEAEVKRLKNELATMKEELRERQDRERNAMQRLDVLMDELRSSKDTQVQAQLLYEKEIRKAKKEAFKSSSTLVKLQEELKSARNTLRSMHSDLDLERIKVQRREQDTYTAQYELVGVREEMALSFERIRHLEYEREELRVSLGEVKAAHVAAEQRLSSQIRNQVPGVAVAAMEALDTPQGSQGSDLVQLKRQLEAQSRALVEAEEHIQFLRMECQLECCSCRLAESQNQPFVTDGTFNIEMQHIKAAVADMLTRPASIQSQTSASSYQQECDDVVEATVADHGDVSISDSTLPNHTTLAHESHQPTNMPLASGTTELLPSPAAEERPVDEVQVSAEVDKPGVVVGCKASGHSTADLLPTTPRTHALQEVPTVTTVPLIDHSNSNYSAFATPIGLTREQAIEQLRQRRGRARSAAGTPRKSLDDLKTPRRDISAPQMNTEARPIGSIRGRGRLRV